MELSSVLGLDEGRWAQAVQTRRSHRAFVSAPSPETLAALERTAKALSGNEVIIEIFDGLGGNPVSAGIRKGTDSFAVIGRRSNPAATGYAGEAFILECEAYGVGTCWAWASCDRRAAQKLLKSGYKLDCVTPLGIASDSPPERRLKPLPSLTAHSEGELAALLPWQKSALAYARLAPSAMNKQPWRFVVSDDGIAAKRAGVMFAAHDCGIAALHLELGARAAGKRIKPIVL